MIKMITLATIKTRSTRNGFIPSHLLRLGVNQTKAELRTSHIPPLHDVLDVGILEMFISDYWSGVTPLSVKSCPQVVSLGVSL